MNADAYHQLWKTIGLRYKSHPWHGIPIGAQAPDVISAFIEITPGDTVKYEIDKPTGYLKIDRPQKFSNIVPALYGFVPQSYCKDNVAAFCMEKTGRTGIKGDDDPLDICVLTERHIPHGDIIVRATPIGGFRLIDNNEADDKIIAVLFQDDVYGTVTEINALPDGIVNRLKHYFLTYKQLPGEAHQCEITHIYGRDEALEVIRMSQLDYQRAYGNLEELMTTPFIEWLESAMRKHDAE